MGARYTCVGIGVGVGVGVSVGIKGGVGVSVGATVGAAAPFPCASMAVDCVVFGCAIGAWVNPA